MSGPHQWLIERIRGEAADLDQVVERTRRGWSLAHKASAEQYAYVDSVALNLHSFYSGVEKIFELIARHIDQTLPKGETWHRDLLQQMAQDVPSRRPAVYVYGEPGTRKNGKTDGGIAPIVAQVAG